MTASNNSAGVASDALLRLTTGLSRPSSYTGRELRREAERNARKAAKQANTRKGTR